jgi:hypothetical protein
MHLRALWSFPLQAEARGLSLAREAGVTLAWDKTHWLYLVGPDGRAQAQRHFHPGLTAATCADDGSACAAASTTRQVMWLTPDLQTRWEKKLPYPLVAVALDPFGQYLAAADVRGHVHFFDRLGHAVSRTQSPRPLHHLTFVPAAPVLLGSADYGLVAAFDLTGKGLWRVGVVAHVGALAVTGGGDLILLACFSEGLQRYGPSGQALGRLAAAEACRLASVSFDGGRLVVGGLGNQLRLLDRGGQLLGIHHLDKPAVGLALGALGKDLIVAGTDGPLCRLALEDGPV